jgi:F-type H+-transporting ATPase subunit delta
MAERDRRIRGYAEAIFAVAQAEDELEQVEDELFRFGKTVESRSDLREALSNPQLPADRKRALVQDLLGDRASRHTAGLLGFLIDQGRGRELPGIVAMLAEVAAARRQATLAEVRTAVPLDAARRDRLLNALERAMGRPVELKVLVDPSVIGGVVVRVGDQVFDGTVRRKLELARSQLSRAGQKG